MTFEILLLTALTVDYLIGDPRWVPHPVCGIGNISLFQEKIFRKIISSEKTAGAVTFFSTVFVSVSIVVLLLQLAYYYSPFLQTVLAVIFIYFFVAVKDLINHSRDVYTALSQNLPIVESRKLVGRIVGRDTSAMNTADICRACVETVAENMVDGITAPIFWAVVFSMFSPFIPFEPVVLAAVGITFYKTVNTMDSMFGYKNDRYLHFGWTAARIDDVVNFIPARLSGVCIIIGAFILRKDGSNSLKIFLRDRCNHSSPNAAHTEAALAGALGLQLGGPAYYFGKKVDKPTIGDHLKVISSTHILQTNVLIVVSSCIFTVILCLFRRLFLVLI